MLYLSRGLFKIDGCCRVPLSLAGFLLSPDPGTHHMGPQSNHPHSLKTPTNRTINDAQYTANYN